MRLGYGTEYEKMILKRIAKEICQRYQIRSACEYPENDLLGEDVIFPRTKKAKRYDLVWNFCEFERQKDPAQLIAQMRQKSRRYLLIITQNHRNPGVFLHFFYHLLVRRPWDHGSLKRMSYQSVLKVLKKFDNLKAIQIGAFDIPWFVLDVYESGKIFRNLPFFKDKLKQLKESRFEEWPLLLKMWLAHHHFLLIKKEVQ